MVTKPNLAKVAINLNICMKDLISAKISILVWEEERRFVPLNHLKDLFF